MSDLGPLTPIGPSQGIYDARRSGLPCRARMDCVTFNVIGNTQEAMKTAIAQRNEHELTIHNYEHVAVPLPKWGYQSRMSIRGRSALPRRKVE